jgi:hypothetical protein
MELGVNEQTSIDVSIKSYGYCISSELITLC